MAKVIDVKKQSAVNSKLVRNYIEAKAEIKKLEAQKTAIKQEIEFKMSQYNVNILVFENDYVQSADVTKRKIDIEKYRKLVSKKEFMDTVSVSVSKAEKLIGESKLNKVSTLTTDQKLITGSL